MILRMLTCVLMLGISLTSTVFAGSERGSRLIAEAGGAAAIPGVAGPAGAPGLAGAAGIQGIPGVPGAPGILDFSDFYALMPGDNAATIGAGTPVLFPQDGSSNGVITRLTDGTFLLPTIGTYLVMFQVSTTEAGQLALNLNSSLIANSVVGRATGTSQIVGISLVTTTTPNGVIEVVNPPGNSPALTITPDAGGTHSVSAHLVIVRIQ